ncbi:MAG TPA: hypothetical protein VGL71_11145 [Urbifossiella sp.]|jgi:hypothetical protein
MNTTSSLHQVRRTLAICGIAAVVESALSLSMAEPVLLLFVLGPLLFLGIIVWRRRTHPTRTRRLAGVALGVGAFGIAAFGVACYQFHANPDRHPSIAPLAVPLVQWIMVIFIWLSISREESREKREKSLPSP